MPTKKCPVCGVSVKVENLERHVKNQHPKAQVDLSEELTEEDREAIKERKVGGQAGLTRGGRRILVVAGIVVAAVVIVAFILSASPAGGPSPGQMAPDWSLPSTNGPTITLSAWRGSVVLLEFMDVDCPYCQEEAPILASLYPNYSARNVHFVSIDINFEGPTDTPTRINAFASQYGTPWPYCLDPNGINGVAKLYKVTATPTSFIINTNGTINHVFQGAQPATNFIAVLNSALG